LSVDHVRFARHLALAEIGPAGQARIGEATAHVGGAGLAGDVATAYAERAGFARVAHDGTPERLPEWVRDASARAVLEGSLSALRAIRDALPPVP
jgi:hypothetical protein